MKLGHQHRVVFLTIEPITHYDKQHARPQAMSLPFQSPTSVAIGPGDFLPESLELSAGVNMPTCMKDEVCLLYAPKSELRPSIKTAGLHKVHTHSLACKFK